MKPPSNEDYRRFIYSQPCAICGQKEHIECHHEPPKGMGGTKNKSDWQRIVPLCGLRIIQGTGSLVPGCHVERHAERFNKRIKAMLKNKARNLYPKLYRDREKS